MKRVAGWLVVVCVVGVLVGVIVHKQDRAIHGQAISIATTGMVAPILSGSGTPSALYTCNAGIEAVQYFDYTGNQNYVCHNGTWVSGASPYLSGTTGTITGTLLAVGGSDTGTATVAGAVKGAPCDASATDGSLPSAGTLISCTVTAANTVTVQVTAYVVGTPGSKSYNVRVLN